MSTAVRSHAKINLGLYIGAPRPDGFHALTTVYQTLKMHDVVTVIARSAGQTSIQLSSNDSRVPTDNRNTAWKMVELALKRLGRHAEVRIHIDKRLPVQGGLGAGSANAVAALVGLERELSLETWGAGPSFERALIEGWEGLQPTDSSDWSKSRLHIAEQVGSDVPLFLVGGTVLGVDRGQRVSPLPDIEPTWCVIVTPPVGVSTPQAFSDWDALCVREGLTQEASADKLSELSRAYVKVFSGVISRGRQGAGFSGVLLDGEDLAGPHESALVRTGITSWIQNDFERVVFPQHPSLAEIKRILATAGTPEGSLHVSLSGSGSALFGLYLTRRDAEAAVVSVKERFPGVEARITCTLPRSEYWQHMLQ